MKKTGKAKTKALVEKWFGGIPRGPDVPPLVAPPVALTGVVRKTITDKVQLPRLYLAWPTPAFYAPGDAALDVVSSVLAGGKNSRLYRRLVYDMQIAQDVTAAQQSQALGSAFLIMATARPGQSLDRIREIIDEEIAKLKETPPEMREVPAGKAELLSFVFEGFPVRMSRSRSARSPPINWVSSR